MFLKITLVLCTREIPTGDRHNELGMIGEILVREGSGNGVREEWIDVRSN